MMNMLTDALVQGSIIGVVMGMAIFFLYWAIIDYKSDTSRVFIEKILVSIFFWIVLFILIF